MFAQEIGLEVGRIITTKLELCVAHANLVCLPLFDIKYGSMMEWFIFLLRSPLEEGKRFSQSKAACQHWGRWAHQGTREL